MKHTGLVGGREGMTTKEGRGNERDRERRKEEWNENITEAAELFLWTRASFAIPERRDTATQTKTS